MIRTARHRNPRPEGGSLRLFVAVGVPERLRVALDVALTPLRVGRPTARWVPRENWHLTVKFLGWTAPGLLPTVEETIREVAARHPAFEAHLEGVGVFPSLRGARVLWAGLADPAGGLAATASDLDSALPGDFASAAKTFTPHLTLARFSSPASFPEGLPEIYVPQEPFKVDGVALYRSHVRGPAPVYEVLGEFRLGA